MAQYLTVQQAAARLNVTPRAIHKWIQAGHLPGSYKLNPHATTSPYRIPLTSIEEFEARRLTPPQ